MAAVGQPHFVRVERAGLVHAEDIDVRDGSTAFFPCTSDPVRQANGAHRIGDDDHQEETRRHDPRTTAAARIVSSAGSPQINEPSSDRDEEERGNHQQQPHHQVDLFL